MIKWKESTEASRVHPLDQLTSKLSVVDALTVMAGSSSAVRVLLSSNVKREVYAHLKTSRSELGGLLVGKVFEFAKGSLPFKAISIEKGIASEEFDSTGVSLRMEAGIWNRVRETLKEDELVVGWYHSHPNLGAFFSGTDRATQAAFFNHDYCIGWVIDPIRNEEKWFRTGDSISVDSDDVYVVAQN